MTLQVIKKNTKRKLAQKIFSNNGEQIACIKTIFQEIIVANKYTKITQVKNGIRTIVNAFSIK